MATFNTWRRTMAVGTGLAGAMVVGAAAGLAWTQEAPMQRGRGPGGSPVFMALDADHDGVLADNELAHAPTALIQLDRNGDGMLQFEEVRPAFGRGGRDGRGPDGRGRGDEPGETPPTSPDELAAALMAFDSNGDGTLARAEVPTRMQGLFDRADADKNGALTEAELKASAAAQRGPAAGRGERGDMEERGDHDGRRRGPDGGPMRGDPLVLALDANKDGSIGQDEIAGAAASLKGLDANGDGQLSLDEVRPAFGRGGRGPRH